MPANCLTDRHYPEGWIFSVDNLSDLQHCKAIRLPYVCSFFASAANISGPIWSSVKAGQISIERRSFHSIAHCCISSASFASRTAKPDRCATACHLPSISTPAGAFPPVCRKRSIAALRFPEQILYLTINNISQLPRLISTPDLQPCGSAANPRIQSQLYISHAIPPFWQFFFFIFIIFQLCFDDILISKIFKFSYFESK